MFSPYMSDSFFSALIMKLLTPLKQKDRYAFIVIHCNRPYIPWYCIFQIFCIRKPHYYIIVESTLSAAGVSRHIILKHSCSNQVFTESLYKVLRRLSKFFNFSPSISHIVVIDSDQHHRFWTSLKDT